MKVAVFGAGALGSVYGARLARRARVDVSFIVRSSRVADPSPIVIESARSDGREEIEAPTRVDVVPRDADVILLTVGTEDLEGLASPLSTRPETPIVVLTPMLPKDFARARDTFGAERLFAAMPSVVAYTRVDGVVRYWLAPAPTKIDEPTRGNPHRATIEELVEALRRAGLSGKLELGVHESNPATTVCFIAIGMALSLAGSVRELTEDEPLMTLTTQACREGVRLAHRIGRPEPWARLAPALAAPWALRTWLRALERLSPEATFYAEEHFGRKLATQHRVMIDEMISLAREKGLPHDAFDEIARRLHEQRRG